MNLLSESSKAGANNLCQHRNDLERMGTEGKTQETKVLALSEKLIFNASPSGEPSAILHQIANVL